MVDQRFETGRWNAYFLVQRKYGHHLRDPLAAVADAVQGLGHGRLLRGYHVIESQTLLVTFVLACVVIELIVRHRSATRFDALVALWRSAPGAWLMQTNVSICGAKQLSSRSRFLSADYRVLCGCDHRDSVRHHDRHDSAVPEQPPELELPGHLRCCAPVARQVRANQERTSSGSQRMTNVEARTHKTPHRHRVSRLRSGPGVEPSQPGAARPDGF